MKTTISLDWTTFELKIGSDTFPLADLPKRQRGMICDAVQNHEYAVGDFDRAHNAYVRSVQSMVSQVEQGYRWNSTFVANDATLIAAKVENVVATEQMVVTLVRMAGLI
jgi:hypothetical protein